MKTDVKAYLRTYDGPAVSLMEVCGTHTAEISRNGIPSMLSPKIRLISGPGCPVCVTVTAYVDRLVELCMRPDTIVTSFGDMLRVKGSKQSLSDAKGEGGHVRMVYSPFQALELAESTSDKTVVFAAVGFETTAPVYALLLSQAVERGISNIRLLTSLKTMPPVIDWLCSTQGGVDGFIAPGHVSVITGSRLFEGLAERWGVPFVVSDFEGEGILAAIYALVQSRGQGRVLNLYPSAVSEDGNRQAQELVDRFFVPCDAAWRGIGAVEGSGLRLREEYARFDAGSEGLTQNQESNPACRCAQVLTGKLSPAQCPLFRKGCSPESPQGACMVSGEGSCYHYYINRRIAQ